MADLKAFVETKLLSKSDKALNKIGHDDHKLSDQVVSSIVEIIEEYGTETFHIRQIFIYS